MNDFALDAMSAEEMVALTKAHSIFSWSAQDAVNPIPIARAQGVYFWDANGKRYFDLNSQLMCVNIGHGEPRVIDAIKRQAEELTYAGPSMASRVRDGDTLQGPCAFDNRTSDRTKRKTARPCSVRAGTGGRS